MAGRGHPVGHADTLFRIFDARKRLRSGFEAAVAISEDHYHATSGHFRAPPRVSYSSDPPASNVTSWGAYGGRKADLTDFGVSWPPVTSQLACNCCPSRRCGPDALANRANQRAFSSGASEPTGPWLCTSLRSTVRNQETRVFRFAMRGLCPRVYLVRFPSGLMPGLTHAVIFSGHRSVRRRRTSRNRRGCSGPSLSPLCWVTSEAAIYYQNTCMHDAGR